ncbi:MAG: Fe-S metabolism protein SufE [Bacteroidia bacterium]|nr:MAG: Fe-S metabolism protein SufE [Bacteroidia bacterium]
MNPIKKIEEEIIDEFSVFGDDWEAKYNYIIELGKELAPISEQYKKDEYLIKGCQSRVWLKAERKNGIVEFMADSDALIPKGIIALLLKLVNHQKAEDIQQYDFDVINKIGLQQHLSPTRANGLVSMINTIKALASNKT